MDENKKYCLLKYLGIVCATFLGAFLAFYFTVRVTVDRFTNPYYIMQRADKMMMRADKDFHRPDFAEAPVPIAPHKHFHGADIINFIRTPDAYKFIIDLKPFHGNSNAVRIETKGREITISGETNSNKKNEEYFTQISQSYLLDDDAKMDKISKKTVKNKYIITIPIED